MGTFIDRFPHLRNQTAEFIATADLLLRFGGGCFLVHSQLIAHASPHLATLLRLSLASAEKQHVYVENHVAQALPVVELRRNTLPHDVSSCTPEQFKLLLRHVYEPGAAIGKVEEAEVLLRLADYFQIQSVMQKVEAWICATLRLICVKPALADTACAAFELATRHRLTQATALLLPWALQQLSRGDRAGVVWYDCQRRRKRVHAAMSQELKAICFDVAIWQCCAHAPRCAACGCRPGDLTPAFDFSTKQQWRGCLVEAAPPLYGQYQLTAAELAAAAAATGRAAGSAAAPAGPQAQLGAAGVPLPGAGDVAAGGNFISVCPYQRAVAHFCHLLQERAWGRTHAAPVE